MKNITPLLLALGLLSSSTTVQNAKETPDSRIQISLKPAVPTEDVRLRWSPKGAKIKLREHDGGLVGSISIGPPTEAGEANQKRIELSKSKAATHFDTLWVDHNGDKLRTDGEVQTCTPSERRNKFWSSFQSTLQLPTSDWKATRPYPISLWFVENPAEPDAAPLLRWSRRGWHQGEFKVEGKLASVLITESTMDGLFRDNDSWSLAVEGKDVTRANSRSLRKHAWLGESAYRVHALDVDGLWITIEPFDPGMTRAEEEAAADVLATDRAEARAKSPLAFGQDFKAAAAAAKAEGKLLFVDFETTWCGPCKTMDALVYTAKKVVDAASARGIVAVKVDGDDQRDLKKKFKVHAYPTMILLDSNGKEIGRRVGYQSVAETVEFLSK
ncbi:MAG: thioredoxin family protein [bacterium]|nr:thioredoxin family protein [bacterium]